MLSKTLTSIHDMSNKPIGGMVAPTSLISGTSSSLPDSITPKASTPHWQGLSASWRCCHTPAPAASAASVARLCSPNEVASAFPAVAWAWCGTASLPAAGLMYHQLWLALPLLSRLHRATSSLAQHKHSALTQQTGLQSTHCPPSQARPKYSRLFGTRQRFPDMPVSRSCWLQVFFLRGCSSCSPR